MENHITKIYDYLVAIVCARVVLEGHDGDGYFEGFDDEESGMDLHSLQK